MRAAVFRRRGPAHEVLSVEEVEAPGPVPARSACASPSPASTRPTGRSAPGPAPLAAAFKVPDQDGAGVVEAVGEGVDPGRVGERVWLYFAAWRRQFGTAAQCTRPPRRPGGAAARRRRVRPRREPRHPGADRAPLPLRRRAPRRRAPCSCRAAPAPSGTPRSSSPRWRGRARPRHRVRRGEGRARARRRRRRRGRLPARGRRRADPRGGAGRRRPRRRGGAAPNLDARPAGLRAGRRHRDLRRRAAGPTRSTCARFMTPNLVLRFVLVYTMPAAARARRASRASPRPSPTAR